MKPETHEAHASDAFTQRDPFSAQDDRTPAEVAAIRSLAAQLDALLDEPPIDARREEPARLDDDLEVTRDALPTLATTQVMAVFAEPERDPEPGPAPEPAASSAVMASIETGLADRMRGVLRGVLDRARRNRPAR